MLLLRVRASIIDGCKPAESPLAERVKERECGADVSRNAGLKPTVYARPCSHSILCCCARSALACMCCWRGTAAAAALIGSHAGFISPTSGRYHCPCSYIYILLCVVCVSQTADHRPEHGNAMHVVLCTYVRRARCASYLFQQLHKYIHYCLSVWKINCLNLFWKLAYVHMAYFESLSTDNADVHSMGHYIILRRCLVGCEKFWMSHRMFQRVLEGVFGY
jgi:hypothetical protein